MNETVDLGDKAINVLKLKKIKDYADYIQKEVEYDLLPNVMMIDEMIELLIDVKRSAKRKSVRGE